MYQSLSVMQCCGKLFLVQSVLYLLNWCSDVITFSFIHSVLCLTTGPKRPPKRFLHIVRSRASSFKWDYPLLSLRSSSSFLRLLSRLLVTYISPFIFPSITCFRRQFLRKMWPIQLAFLVLISCRIVQQPIKNIPRHSKEYSTNIKIFNNFNLRRPNPTSFSV